MNKYSILFLEHCLHVIAYPCVSSYKWRQLFSCLALTHPNPLGQLYVISSVVLLQFLQEITPQHLVMDS